MSNQFEDNKILVLELSLTRSDKKNELLEERCRNLENDLQNEKINIMTLKSQNSSSICDYESNISNYKIELSQHQYTISSLKDRITLQNEKIDDSLMKINKLESSNITQQFEYSKEIESLTRIKNDYKFHLDDAIEKIKEMEKELIQKEVLSKKSIEELNNNLQLNILSTKELLFKERADNEAIIISLKEKLEQKSIEIESDNTYNNSLIDEISIFSSIINSENNSTGYDVNSIIKQMKLYESNYINERKKTEELEFQIIQLNNEIDELNPVYMENLQNEYNILLESYSTLQNRTDVISKDAINVKKLFKKSSQQGQEYLFKIDALDDLNKDLSKQVQHLLAKVDSTYNNSSNLNNKKSPSNHTYSSEHIISSHLVVYDDIAELQARNMQLLTALRSLSKDQEDEETLINYKRGNNLMKDITNNNDELMIENLNVVAQELEKLKDARLRAEELVEKFKQGKGFNNSLVDESPDKNHPSVNRSLSLGGSFTTFPSVDNNNKLSSPGTSNYSADIKKKNAILENEVSKVTIELTQSEAKVVELKKELENIKQENTKNSYNYNNEKLLLKQEKDKFNQINNKIELITNERNNLLTIINELQNKIIQIENNYRVIENKYTLSESNIATLKNNLSSTQIELKSVKKSEMNLTKQLTESYDNLSKQSSFDKSIKRIEADLILKSEVEKNILIQERDALLKNISSLHREMSEQSINDDQRCRLLSSDLKDARNNIEKITNNLLQITNDLINEQLKSSSLQETNDFLTKQFNISQERFENLSKTLNPTSANLYTCYETVQSTTQMELDKALLELTSLRSDLISSNRYADQYRFISEGLEAKIKENEILLEDERASNEEAYKSLTCDLTALKTLRNDDKNKLALLKLEIEKLQDIIRLKEMDEDLIGNELQTECLLNQETIKLSQDKINELEEIIKLNNIEKDKYLKDKLYYDELENKISIIDEECIRLRSELLVLKEITVVSSVVQDQEKKYSNMLDDAKIQIEGLRRINDIIVGQNQSLGIQLDRMRASNTSSLSLISNLSNSHITNDDVSSEMMTDTEAKQETNRAETELREVCRYMRQERESLQEKLSISNMENRHLKASLESSQRSLAEVKVELKIELDKRSITKEDDDFDKLLSNVSHLNKLKENNTILLLENNDLNTNISELQMELKDVKQSIEPLKKVNIDNIEKMNTLESINLALVIERNEINKRLQTLISRYKDVDPEIHRQLVVASEEKETEYTALETRHKENESHAIKLRNYLVQYKTSAKENAKELESLKKLNEELNDNNTTLNTTITNNSEQIKNLQSQISDHQGKLTQKDSLITVLQNKVSSLQNQNNIDNKDTVNAAKVVLPTKSASSFSLITTGSSSNTNDGINRKRKDLITDTTNITNVMDSASNDVSSITSAVDKETAIKQLLQQRRNNASASSKPTNVTPVAVTNVIPVSLISNSTADTLNTIDLSTTGNDAFPLNKKIKISPSVTSTNTQLSTSIVSTINTSNNSLDASSNLNPTAPSFVINKNPFSKPSTHPNNKTTTFGIGNKNISNNKANLTSKNEIVVGISNQSGKPNDIFAKATNEGFKVSITNKTPNNFIDFGNNNKLRNPAINTNLVNITTDSGIASSTPISNRLFSNTSTKVTEIEETNNKDDNEDIIGEISDNDDNEDIEEEESNNNNNNDDDDNDDEEEEEDDDDDDEDVNDNEDN